MAIRLAWLTELITQVHADSKGTYGVPRVRAELVMGRGICVGHNAVIGDLEGPVQRPEGFKIPDRRPEEHR